MTDPPGDLDFFLTLTLASSKAWPLVQRAFAEAGVDPGNWGLLVHVGARGRVTPTQLAEETGMTTTTMRDQIQAFVDRGLLRREPNPRDARSYLVALTRRGEREVERGRAATALLVDALGARFGELEQLRASLLELIVVLNELHDDADDAERRRRVEMLRRGR